VRPAATEAQAFEGGWRAAVAYCRRREHLRRTLRIALVVGIVLTAMTISPSTLTHHGERSGRSVMGC
jgi:hypothetical protein